MAAALPDRLPGDRVREKHTGRTGTIARTDPLGRTVWIPDDAPTAPSTAHDDTLEPAR